MTTPDLAFQASGWRDSNPRPLRPELRAGRSMVVIFAGRRPVKGVMGWCWSAALLYCAAVPLRWPRRVGTGHGPVKRTRRGSGR